MSLHLLTVGSMSRGNEVHHPHSVTAESKVKDERMEGKCAEEKKGKDYVLKS